MEDPAFLDHVLAAGLAILSLALASGRMADGTVGERLSFYKAAIASSIALPVAVLGAWVANGRSLAGFGLYGWTGDASLTLALGAVWLLLVLLSVLVVSRGLLREQLRPVYTRFAPLMPSNRRELAASWITSTFAGSGEEIVYRGFLLWYGASLIGVPAALVVSSLLFGAAHGYQSRWGIMFATVAGLVLGGIYVASGSLLLVMWAHATYNMASFYIGGMIILPEADRGDAGPQPAEQLF